MKQRQMPMMGEAPKAKPVSVEQLKSCESVLDAIQMCVMRAPYRKNYLIAELIGMRPAHFSKCINGTENFPPDLLEPLEDVCQCSAVTQYLMLCRGFEQPELDERQRRKQELLAELKQLEDEDREAG